MSNLTYILISFAVIYLIRFLPLVLIRKPIQSHFIRSFLYYVPYATLAVMTFPAIVETNANPFVGIVTLAAGIFSAIKWKNLPVVAGVCVVVYFILDLII